MREIKFRVWVKPWKWMDFPTSISIDDSGHIEGVRGYGGDYPYTDIELMQYTGLNDKNGREIYESDIVRNPYKYAQPHVSEVFIEGGNTYLSGEDLSTGGDMLLCDYADQCEVIGNIYKNPELLEALK